MQNAENHRVMQSFVDELIAYMDEAEERNIGVVSIKGLRAMLARHQTAEKAPRIDFRGKIDGLSIEERNMLREANRGFKIDRYKEVR